MREDIVIQVKNLSKLYGLNRQDAIKMMEAGADKAQVQKKTGVTVALWDVNLSIPRGKIFVIIGLSGSGKSTLVRCFNRLNRPTSGQVLFEGRDLMKLTSQELLRFRRTKISMVFQSFGLMDHRDVLGNVCYGLEVRGLSRETREQKARDVIRMVGLEGWEHHSCASLSGGMRQRVGIARALASDPEVLLMDEPFSALDPLVRRDMQFELLQLQQKLGKTIIFITHDIDEAFQLGDTVAIMRDGRVVQVASPEERSARPADDYVRAFIDTADKSKVLSAGSIMITPTALVRLHDSVEHAIRVMNRSALSTVYVVDNSLRLAGILPISEALRAKKEGLHIREVLQTKLTTTTPETLVSDIMPLAAEAPYPIPVVDEEGQLRGIVTRASVLSSLI